VKACWWSGESGTRRGVVEEMRFTSFGSRDVDELVGVEHDQGGVGCSARADQGSQVANLLWRGFALEDDTDELLCNDRLSFGGRNGFRTTFYQSSECCGLLLHECAIEHPEWLEGHGRSPPLRAACDGIGPIEEILMMGKGIASLLQVETSPTGGCRLTSGNTRAPDCWIEHAGDCEGGVTDGLSFKPARKPPPEETVFWVTRCVRRCELRTL